MKPVLPLVRISLYRTSHGKVPFSEWFDRLRDRKAQQIVDQRLTRVAAGNFGDTRSLGAGVHELRIAYGPGYRIYFGKQGEHVVVLLIGGDKKTQSADIERAKEFWEDYKGRS